MAAYLIRRLWQMIPTLVGVVLLVFLLFKYFGGDPAEILGGLNATPSRSTDPRAARPEQPWWVQLWHLREEIVTFDWGRSWATNESVAQHLRHAAAGDADGDDADPAARGAARVPFAMSVAYVRGTLTDRPIMSSARSRCRSASWSTSSSASTCSASGSAGSRCRAGATLADQPGGLRAAAGDARGARRPGAADAPVPHLLPRRDRPGLRAHRARQGPDREPVLFKHVLRNAMIPILTNVAGRCRACSSAPS